MNASPPPAGPGHHDTPAGARLAALRARGAEHLDPLHFRFLEALARRSAEAHGLARPLLETRLAQALDAYAARCDDMPGPAGLPPEPSPQTAAPSPLAELLAHLARQNRAAFAGPQPAGTAAAPAELKALSVFRESWSKLRVDQQFHQALADEPENAGPLNSHLLVLRALRRMRDISPGYLKHFMAYADALLWLEQADGGAKPAPKNIVLGERDKKPRKAARGKDGN